MSCSHPPDAVQVVVQVGDLLMPPDAGGPVPADLRVVELWARCSACGAGGRFVGAPVGSWPIEGPRASATQSTLQVPIAFDGPPRS